MQTRVQSAALFPPAAECFAAHCVSVSTPSYFCGWRGGDCPGFPDTGSGVRARASTLGVETRNARAQTMAVLSTRSPIQTRAFIIFMACWLQLWAAGVALACDCQLPALFCSASCLPV